uniref:Protein kinase domain-containing protein n=1 Tax=viral metagenome TaxID=1070528 RepID=A0A6C0BEN5_9ZZZZ
MNISKLLRIITLQKTITRNFLNVIIQDDSIPPSIKRKVILYVNGDRRLSIQKLINDIKKIKQNGGVGVGVNIFNWVKITQPLQQPQQPQQPQQIQSVIINNVEFNIGTKIGEGTFAEVFVDKNVVLKLFKTMSTLDMFTNIKLCITEFLENFTTQFTSFPKTTNIFMTTHNNIFVENVIVRNESRYGYILDKHHGTLSQLVKQDLNIEVLNKVTDYLTNKNKYRLTGKDNKNKYRLTGKDNINYIHGDIKLENILYTDNSPYIHDFDGVFVYNEDTLSHIIMTLYTREIYITPLFTHPFFAWYKYHIRTNNINDIINNMKTEVTNHMLLWKSMCNLNTSSNSSNIRDLQTYIQECLDYIYEDIYGSFIETLFKKENNLIIDWIKEQLPLFDKYSFGMSLLIYTQIYLPNQSENKEKIETLFNLSFEIIKESLIIESSKGGAKQVKRNKRGGMPPPPKLNLGTSQVDLNQLYEEISQTVIITDISQTQNGGYKIKTFKK